jgi:hypothetical protein
LISSKVKEKSLNEQSIQANMTGMPENEPTSFVSSSTQKSVIQTTSPFVIPWHISASVETP